MGKFASRSDIILKNYHRWCSTSLPCDNQKGVSFQDCYLETRGGLASPVCFDLSESQLVQQPMCLARGSFRPAPCACVSSHV